MFEINIFGFCQLIVFIKILQIHEVEQAPSEVLRLVISLVLLNNVPHPR
jgi:hypothetical protein